MQQKIRKISKSIYLTVMLLTVVTAIFATLLAPAGRVSAAGETVSIWITTADHTKLLQPQSNVSFGPDTGSASYTVDVDESTTYQTMDGFGASITDSSASLLYSLSATQRDQVMTSIFSPTSGIGMSFVRQVIGSSDFVNGPHYSYDDMPSGQTDLTMANFSIAHDQAQIIPLLQRALQLNPNLKVMASTWSQPAWMKTNNSYVGGQLKNDPAIFQAYALYLLKFIQAYEAAGIPIYAITPQNEPQNRTPLAYPGTDMPVAHQNAVIAQLGPMLQAAGLSRVKIISYDHNWVQHPDDVADAQALGVPVEPNYALDALNGSAAQYIAGTGYHMYSGDASVQTTMHNTFPNKDIWFTEGSGYHANADAFSKYFSDTLTWQASNISIASTRNWAKGVLNWNLALNSLGKPANGGCGLDTAGVCTGVIAIDGTTVTNNAEYYVIGHFSKFVQQGAVRISSNTNAGAMEDVAFRNPDGSKVVVVLNKTGGANTVKLRWGGQSFVYTLPVGALATFTWAGNPGPTPTPLPPPLSRTGWVASASVSGSDVPANALDGNASTRWSTGTAQVNGQWFQVDMLSSKTFAGITLDTTASSGDFPNAYQVFVSNDGTNWGSAIATGSGSAMTTISFATQNARYIRVTQTGSSGSWWSIHEFNVYGSSGPTATAGPSATFTRTATAGPSPTAAPGGIASIWVTTGDQSKLLQPQANVNFAADSGSNPLTIDVNEAVTYQQIDGFGASFTDSSAWLVWNKLSTAQRTTLMNDLFNPTTGIGLSYLRQPISSSDFALSNYTYDDMPAGQTDTSLANFSIAHDTAYIIPVINQARSINPNLKVMITPWSAPAWMKSNQSLLNGGSLNTSAYAAYANYFVKVIQAYAAQGVPISALTIQNEPQFAPAYPGMLMSASEQANFIKNNLGPALASAGLTTKIVAFDHNWDTPAYPQTVLADTGAYPYIDGSAFHCYAGTVDAQTTVHNAYPNKNIYFTECTGGDYSPAFAGNLQWDLQNLVIGATRNWAKTVVKWNMALDTTRGPTNGGCTNCRGVVTINQSTGAVIYEVEYYALGHASKFVVPGAYRISSNTFGTGSIEDVAFKNPDGSKVVIVLNSGTVSNTFKIRAGGQSISYTLPAGGVATFKWAGASGPTATPTATLTSGPSQTPTRTLTVGPTATRTITLTVGPSVTATLTLTAGPTATVTRTLTPGPTATRTATPIASPSRTITATATRTPTPTLGASPTAGPTATRTNTPVAPTATRTPTPGSGPVYYTVTARHSGKCLDVSGNSTGDGAWMQQWTCAGATNQNFQFVPVAGTSYYQIIARNSGKCMDVQNNSTSDGALIQQWTCGTGTNQQFTLQVVAGTSYINIIARSSGKCFDVQNVSTSDGAWIQQWTCGTGTNQQWSRTVVP